MIKKSMPRQARLDYPGCYHHIMGRGIAGLKIFRKETEKQDFLSCLKEIKEESSMQIHAWCIMDNHFHLLYETGQTNLSTYMRKLLTGYAINYNKRNRRKGYVFQGRYKSTVIDADEYYIPLVRYIHLNPVKTKVVIFSKLKEYPWTGHKEIMSKQKDSLISSKDILGYFGQKELAALKAYEEYLAEGIDKEDKHLLGGGLIRSVGGWKEAVKISKDDLQISDERILGSSNFVEGILNKFEQKERLNNGFKNVDDLLYKITKLYKVDREKLTEMKTKEVREARSIFVYLAVKELGMSVKATGRILKIKESAASSGVRRGMQIEKEKGILKLLCD